MTRPLYEGQDEAEGRESDHPASRPPGPGGWDIDRAISELYAVHYRALVRLAALLVRDMPTAEEVVQDAFVAMHGGWQRLQDSEKALTYLRQAVVNRSRSVLRHRRVADGVSYDSLSLDAYALSARASAENRAIAELEAAAMDKIVLQLPRRQRDTLVLTIIGYSPAEIACLLGIDANAVRVNLHHARQRVRNRLSEADKTLAA
jgi:RNA polymerase sigma factor (sigma-70 family)